MPLIAADLKVGDKIRYDGGADYSAHARDWEDGRVVTVKSVAPKSVNVDVPYHFNPTTNLSDSFSLKHFSKVSSAVKIERAKPVLKDPISTITLGKYVSAEPSHTDGGKVFLSSAVSGHYDTSDVREYAHALLELCDQVEA